MKIAYLDTASGIAGDMMLAALVDAGADGKLIENRIRSLALPGLELLFSNTIRCGFRALQMDVRYPPESQHRRLSDIEEMIENSLLEPRAKDIALRVFRRIGHAEARVHGVDVESVHFHEVGAVDSIADIVGVAVGLAHLGIERIFSGPPAVGTGTVNIAHGLVSVPTPATAELLMGIPLRTSQIQAELTTPTGAGILATLCDYYGPMPGMTVEAIGYGAGHKDFPQQPNILRMFIGHIDATHNSERVVPEFQSMGSPVCSDYDYPIDGSTHHDHHHDHHHHHH